VASKQWVCLLHVFHPDKRREDQEGTWDFLRAYANVVGGPVIHWPTTGEDGYWKALEAVWDWHGPLLVLEQDIVPTWAHLNELLGCPEEYCAWDFRLANGVPWSEVPGGHGFGFAKFSSGRRGNIVPRPQVPHVPWPDTVPTLHLRLGTCHVHQPCIEHHHGLA
jgi:hypothetical protein